MTFEPTNAIDEDDGPQEAADVRAVRPAADLAHAAEDVRKHLALRAHAVNEEVIDNPDVLAVAYSDGHGHALTESVVRTLLAERDALAAYVDRQLGNGSSDEAPDAAARLTAWFKAEGPLVMDEADFDDVQAVLADYARVRAELAARDATGGAT